MLPRFALAIQRYPTRSVDSAFDSIVRAPISPASRSPRASPETSQSRSGMRRPACAARNRAPGRRPETRPDGERTLTTAMSNGFTARGPEPKNRRGGAPRGERPPAAQAAQAGLRGDARRVATRLRVYVTGPPTGAAAPKRLSALRSLFCRGSKRREKTQTSEGSCLARTMMLVWCSGRCRYSSSVILRCKAHQRVYARLRRAMGRASKGDGPAVAASWPHPSRLA